MLPVLQEVPQSIQDWDRWGFHHRASHDAIRQAIAAQGTNLPDFPLYPVNQLHFDDFLTANAQTHIQMNGYLGTQGANLQDVDVENQSQLSAWIWIHYQEHDTAERALGL